MIKLFKNYSPQDLRDAIEIELLITNDILTATNMAKARLHKDPKYYRRLMSDVLNKAARHEKNKVAKVMGEFNMQKAINVRIKNKFYRVRVK